MYLQTCRFQLYTSFWYKTSARQSVFVFIVFFIVFFAVAGVIALNIVPVCTLSLGELILPFTYQAVCMLFCCHFRIERVSVFTLLQTDEHWKLRSGVNVGIVADMELLSLDLWLFLWSAIFYAFVEMIMRLQPFSFPFSYICSVLQILLFY